MKVYKGKGWKIYQDDVLSRLARLPAESVNCVVTSPPYWSLRKYDAPDVVWGGDPDCPHTLEAAPPPKRDRQHLAELGERDGSHGGKKHSTGEQYGVPGGYTGKARWQHDGVSREETPEAWVKEHGKSNSGGLDGSGLDGAPPGLERRPSWETATCSRCGAWRGQYGLEPTPGLYVEHTLMVLRAIRRVLRDDGVIFWNIGDSYSGSGQSKGSDHGKAVFVDSDLPPGGHPTRGIPGLKPKDLVLMPERVALAAQADGWWVRQRIIWHKPNAMPESAKDRPTDDHEIIWMLTKNGDKPLYWTLSSTGEVSDIEPRKRGRWDENVDWEWRERTNGKRIKQSLWEGHAYWSDFDAVREPHTMTPQARLTPRDFVNGKDAERAAHRRPQYKLREEADVEGPEGGRNIRTVWRMNTASTPEAHFATFPEELPRRCILASCPAEVCATCGKARERIMERNGYAGERADDSVYTGAAYSAPQSAPRGPKSDFGEPTSSTTGWTDCGHDNYAPGVVLDPFCGLATTGIVAKRLGRRFIGIELSEKYAKDAATKMSIWWKRFRTVPTSAETGHEKKLKERGLASGSLFGDPP